MEKLKYHKYNEDNITKFMRNLKEKIKKDFIGKGNVIPKFQKNIKIIVSTIAISMSIFQFYTGTFGLLTAMRQRSLHLMFGLVLAFLLYPISDKRMDKSSGTPKKIDILFILLSFFGCGYMFIFYPQIALRPAMPTISDLVFGGICTISILEATRRTVGKTLPIIAIIFLSYAYFGPYFPSFFAHRAYSLGRIINQLYLGPEGIFGIPIGVSASFVYLFILFGSFLGKSGLTVAFIEFASALAGKSAGGPAKIAVISSGLMGSISGSSVANVVATGAFTIPLMKKVGYDKNFAGAVEAAASTGGQILPPVMGAAAFIMAEFLNISYIKICMAAAIPAIIYFFSVGISVHFRAKRIGLAGISETPNIKTLLVRKAYLFAPIIVIIYFLVKGFTPLRAAVMAIICSVITGLINRMTLRDILIAMEEAAHNSVTVVAACASAGIIIGIVTLTGIGLKIAHLVLSLSGGSIFFALVLTMVASIILGMGLPTTAKYIILVTIAGPALVTLGILPLAAHLFVFYFGIFADVTPPVALAAYAATGISGGDSFKTGLIAFRLAIAGFIVPYVFCFDNGLILLNSSLTNIFILILTTVVGITLIICVLEGYLITISKIYERILLSIAAFLFLVAHNNSISIAVGILIVLVVIYMQTRRIKYTNKSKSVYTGIKNNIY